MYGAPDIYIPRQKILLQFSIHLHRGTCVPACILQARKLNWCTNTQRVESF